MGFYILPKKSVAIFLIMLLLLSCKNKHYKDSVTTEEGFEMYQMSEMSILMEQMHAYHEVQKSQLLQGKTPGEFPEYFLNIHTAVLTDVSDNDTIFKDWANRYIQYEKAIYSDQENAKHHYNKAINACIQCHEQKCTGPIPRIKKLLILD